MRFAFPHPIDILVAKVKRVAPKDISAFHMMIKKTGHPTEEDLIMALRRHVDIFRPNFDEENSTDAVANAQVLWREVYGRAVDVRQEIIILALAERRRHLNPDIPDWRSQLPH